MLVTVFLKVKMNLESNVYYDHCFMKIIMVIENDILKVYSTFSNFWFFTKSYVFGLNIGTRKF